MWAVRNLAERFCDRYDFFIVTRDCDGKLDETPYVKIARNKWSRRPEAKIYYASPSNLRPRTFESLIDEIKPDAIYLNSIFSKVCVTFLLARRLFLSSAVPVLLAPCGELSDAALSIKRLRKRIFFGTARVLGTFRDVIWKATSESERAEISRFVAKDAPIKVAPELTPKDILPDFKTDDKPQKIAGRVQFVYFSRITPKKNLHFLLELLNEIDVGSVDLEVIGDSDDDLYFEKCRRTAASLPANINVKFVGSVDNESVLEIAKNSHFMVLPTKNENFGYVVIESLAAGCPVLMSDQIEWKGIQESNVGWRLPLDDRGAWLSKINACISMGDDEYRPLSFSARQFAVRYLIADEPTAANQLMFDTVLAA